MTARHVPHWPRMIRVAPLIILAASLLVVPLMGVFSERADADFSPVSADTGAQNLALCFHQYRKLAVELLIDQTASLQYGDNGIAGHGPGSDPDGKRVVLAQSVVQALAQVQGIAGGTIEVQAAGFGTDVEPVSTGPNGWTAVTSASAESISASLEQFRNRDSDVNTDYVTALSTANQNLQQERQSLGTQTCTAIVLFTDGAFSLNPGAAPPWYGTVSSAEATDPNSAVYAQGIKDLCAPDGIMDSLRSYDPPVFLFAAGLAPTPPPAGPAPDFSLLRGLALGTAVPGYATCGTPNGTGEFFDGNVNTLSSSLISGLVGGSPTAAACTEAGCSASFVTYPYTKSASVYVTANEPGQLSIAGLGGESVPVPPLGTSKQVDGVTLTTSIANPWPGQSDPGYQWLIGLTGFEPAADGKPTTWSIRFTPTPSSSPPTMTWQANVVSGVELVPEATGLQWRRGDEGDAYYRLVDGTTQIPAEQISDATLAGTVALEGAPTTVPVAEEGQSNRFRLTTPPIDPTTTATAATVRISGSIALRSGEVVPIEVTPPAIPVVAPHGPQPATALQFGLLEATLSQQRSLSGVQPVDPVAAYGELPVAAGPDGPGTFCIRSAPDVTEAGAAVSVRAPGTSCRHVRRGQVVDVPLVLRIGKPLSGRITGSIVATTQWIDGTTVYSWTIPVTGTVVVPPGSPIVDQTTLWLLVVGSVLGAAALWFVMCWCTAVLSRETTRIQHYQVEATLDASSSPPAVHFVAPNQDEFQFVLMPNGPGRTAVSRGLELKAPIRLFRPQDVVVQQSGVVVNGTLGATGGVRSSKGRIEHRIQGQWIFTTPTSELVAEDAEVIEGILHYFVPHVAAGTESRPGGLLDVIRTDLPLHFERIRARASRPGAEGISEAPDDAATATEPSVW